MIDAVLAWHSNPHTCGVSKFSARLARCLGVPYGTVRKDFHRYAEPLVSLKFSEAIDLWPGGGLSIGHRFHLFTHDIPPGADDFQHRWLDDAVSVYAANPVIADTIRARRPDVMTAFCPATVEGNPIRGELRILTFGMAGKLQTAHYTKLKTLLDATGLNYTVSLSTAVHEGSPWSSVAEAGDQLRTIFGDRTRMLGYLLDDGLAYELEQADGVALFFDPALRANNTTFWAALEGGRPVITNLDARSPDVSALTVANITTAAEWCPPIMARTAHSYTWDALLQLMGVSTAI